jgi:ABC-2 type transport system ATP-binding protein
MIVEFDFVSKSYKYTKVINEISFSVNKGEIFGLLGPNGAGKTTIIRMLLNIIKADSGVVKVFGSDASAGSKDLIGYLPEERGLYKKEKVLELLVYLAKLKGISQKQAIINAEKWLQSIGMHEHKGKKIEELSKGMQQKVQFISAVIHDPDLIILDEPFSGLDSVNAKVIRDMILECKKAGKTIILSTHMMEQAQTLCDRIMMINKGSIVLYDTVDNIRKDYYENSLLIQLNGNSDALNGITEIKKIVYHENSVEIFLKDSGTIQTLIEELNKRVEILRFEQSIPSLNDIYIKLVEGSINDKIVNSC